MRLVQLTISEGDYDSILSALDERDIDYIATEETSRGEYAAVVYVPLPKQAVEPVLDDLRDAGLSEDSYTVVVDAETVISKRFDDLQAKYEDDRVESERISRQELLVEAQSLTPTIDVYVTLTIVSAVVACAGLFLDSAAVVVGSMVIAPLIGPTLGASVGSVLSDEELFRSSLRYQLLGVVLAIVAAAVFAFVVRFTNVVPPGLDIGGVDEIDERLAPDMLSLAIALGAGVAGVVSISTGIGVALVGVMIAAALIPPAAAAGIAIAWGDPAAATGATVLVFVNLLSVNLAGLVTLWYMGYRPENLWDVGSAETRVRRRAIGLVAVVAVFSVVLGAISYDSFRTSSFEDDVNDAVEAVLAEEEAYQLLDLEVEMDESFPIQSPERVVVTVGGPSAEESPELAEALRERIAAQTDADVTVQVRFVGVVDT